MDPWVTYLRFGGRKVSDIEYLSIKESDGKLVTNNNTRTSVGDGATLTAGSGKDLYLAKARVNFTSSVAGGTSTIALKVNGVIKEEIATLSSGQISGGSGGGFWNYEYKFAVAGLKVAATQIIKIEVTALGSNHKINSVLVGFEEDTGVDPRI